MKNRVSIYHPPIENPFAEFEQTVAANIPEAEGPTAEAEMQQRTIEWFLHRWDKFTGSKMPDLMKQGRGKDDLWGETAKNVIFELASYATMTPEGREQYAIEQMYKDFRQTKWGNEYEPEARVAYAEATKTSVFETGFTTHPTIPYLGGSFDGQTLGGIIEIKCPYDPVKHLKNANLKLKGIDSKHEYYGQMQCNIEVAGVEWCDFVSYDPRQQGAHKLVVIRVDRDPIYIAAMLERVHEAKNMLDLYLSGHAI